jgi:AcrR family transcriptional regulator
VAGQSSASTTGKRPYDARRRRERAEAERQATRAGVVEAASRLFVANGYTATTMAAIAREAGVAIQSVYSAAQSKAELLRLVVDRAMAGDDEDLDVHDQPLFAAIVDAPDPEAKLTAMAAMIADVQERSAPVQAAYREAAATDATVAAAVEAAHQRRYETFGVAIQTLPPERLRYSYEDTLDTAWAVGSTEVFMLLRRIRGWDAKRYADWLSRTLIDQLLLPA